MDFQNSTFNRSYSGNPTRVTPASSINGLNLGYEESVEPEVIVDDIRQGEEIPETETTNNVVLVHEDDTSSHTYDDEDVVRVSDEETRLDDYVEVVEETFYEDPSSTIEGAPYSRQFQGNPRHKNQQAMNELTFGTEYVAKELGVSSQAIRNYVEDYNEFLNIEISSTGKRHFRQEQIDKLRNIMQIKAERGFTTARMQAYLRDPNNEKKVASPEERMEEMFSKLQQTMQQSMMESMRAFAGELLENNTKLLEMKESMNNQIVDELKEQVIDQGKAITELLDLVKNQSMDDKKYEESLHLIEELKSSIQQKDKNLEELTATIKKQQEEYEHLQKTTRKKIFGLF